MDDAQNARDISNILEQLVREEMLPHEQYEKLVDLEELDLPSVVEIIKETKIGQKFELSRPIGQLKKMLQSLLEELAITEKLIV